MKAVRCDLLTEGHFPPPDARQGTYAPGQTYRVGEDLPAEKVRALVAGGGFTPVDE